MGSVSASTVRAAMIDAPLIICFSGRIGSGKSSVTDALSQAFGWSRAGFGDYLRHRVADEGGDASSRQALQDLGQLLVETDPDAFCLAVLKFGGYQQGYNLLVDGIRHVDIYRRVVRLTAPSLVRLIHLEADDSHVRDRVATRLNEAGDLSRAEGHRVEADLTQSLPSIADVIINANNSLDVVLAECVDTFEKFGVPEATVHAARKSLAAISS